MKKWNFIEIKDNEKLTVRSLSNDNVKGEVLKKVKGIQFDFFITRVLKNKKIKKYKNNKKKN